jgi:hypothetical protein
MTNLKAAPPAQLLTGVRGVVPRPRAARAAVNDPSLAGTARNGPSQGWPPKTGTVVFDLDDTLVAAGRAYARTLSEQGTCCRASAHARSRR